jgi:hypothetical protein
MKIDKSQNTKKSKPTASIIPHKNRRKSTELPTEFFRIIPSQNLSVYTDSLDLSAKRSVYTDRNIPSVSTDRFADGVYSLSGNIQRRGDVRRFYRRNDRGIQTEIGVQ